jgi:hypothetical protein
MRTPRLSELEARLLEPPEPDRFGSAELEGLPEPVQRHLAQAIAAGTPLFTSARLRMRGHIKVGRWLPFRAHQLLNPHNGFVWTARAAGIIAGSDRYLDGDGGQNWKLLSLLTVAHAEGPDVSRSAAGRAGAEAIWGDPDNRGAFGWHRFGGEFTGYRSFHGLTIPSQGRLGWFYGQDRWPAGDSPPP